MDGKICTIRKKSACSPGQNKSRRSIWQVGLLLFLAAGFNLLWFSTANAQNDFRQAANNDNPYSLGNPHWINSIVQQSNSKYYEGMSVPQRVILKGLSGPSHTVTLSHQSIKASNNSHAYDFLTSWEQAQSAAGIYTSTINLLTGLFTNECGPEPSSDPSGFLTSCSGATHILTASIPDNMEAVLGDNISSRITAYEAFIGSDRTIKIKANAPVTNLSIDFVVSGGTMYTGTDKDANYIISWTSPATEVVLEFAGHLAIGVDPFNNTAMGYGPGEGAGAINGGPYHFNLYKLDLASLGSQDNQIKGADVLALPPVECTVSGPPSICASTNSYELSAVVQNGGVDPTYTVAISGNTGNGLITSSTAGTYSGPVTISVGPGAGGFTAGGTVTVVFTVFRNGQQVSQCSKEVTVYPLPDANGQSLAICKNASGQVVVDLNSLVPSILGAGGTGNVVDWFYDEALTNPIPAGSISTFTVSSSTTIRARVTNPTTGCVKSAPVTITPIDKPVCSISPENLTICSGQSNLVFNATPGMSSYLWTVSGGTITGGQGTDQITVTAGASGNLQVSVVLTSNNCSSECSRTYSINGNPNCSISGDNTICAGNTTSFVASGGATYSWTGPGGFTSTNASTGPISVAGDYTVTVTTTGGCVGSCTRTLTVNNVTASVVGPNQTICYGGNPGLISATTAATGSGVLSYQWQSAASCNGPWTNIAGATESSFDPASGITANISYRVVVTSILNGVPCTANSNCVTVTVNNVAASVIGSDQNICAGGDPAAFTVTTAATGSGVLSYQWQSAASCNGPWTNIAGATNATYDVPGGLATTTSYRVVVKSTLNGVVCDAASNCVTVTVNNLTPAVIGDNQTVCSGGDPAALTITTNPSGAGPYTYQWQTSTAGCDGPWTDIAGATSNSYDPASTTVNRYYRLHVYSPTCDSYSNCVSITVNNVSVNVPDAGQTLCNQTDPAPITAIANGSGVITYQWQRSNAGCGPLAVWTNIAGATGSSYDPPAMPGSAVYRVVVSSTINGVTCSANSTCIFITVNNVTPVIVNADPQTVCAGGDPAEIIANVTGDGVLTYQWQSSASCDGPFTNIAGATSVSYNPPAGILTTTAYRLLVTSTVDGVVCSANSACVLVTVNKVGASVVGPNQTICAGGDPGLISATTNATGSGLLTYQWQRAASCNGPWTNIAGATESSYDPAGGISTNTSYRVMVTSTLNGVICSAYSNCVTVTVNKVEASVIGTDQNICTGGDPAAFTATTAASGSGVLTYQWQTAARCAGPWTNIPGATSATYDAPGGLNANTSYRVVVTSTLNGVICSANSNCVSVTVNPCNHACTYTQGAYGGPGGNHCNGDGTTSVSLQQIQLALTNTGGSYTFGNVSTNRYFVLNYADASNVFNMLPGGGPSQKFGYRVGGATYGNAASWSVVPLQPTGAQTGTIKNTLFAQTMTMYFNLNQGATASTLSTIGIVDTFITAAASQCNFVGAVPVAGTEDTFAIPHALVTYLSNPANGYTNNVAGLFKLANDVLGGVNTSVIPSDVTSALDAFNRGFDKCRFLMGTVPYVKPLTIVGLKAAQTGTEIQGIDHSIVVNASPNPYTDKIVFTVKSSVAGKASLELYGLLGDSPIKLFDGYMDKNAVKTFTYNAATAQHKSIVYRFRVGDKVVSGKVLYAN